MSFSEASLSGKAANGLGDNVTSSFGWHWPQAEAGGGRGAISISVYQRKRGWHWAVQLSKDRVRCWGGRGRKRQGGGERKGTWETKMECVCLCARERKKARRGETVISWHGGSEMWQAERKRCSISAVRVSRNQRQTLETAGSTIDDGLPR